MNYFAVEPLLFSLLENLSGASDDRVARFCLNVVRQYAEEVFPLGFGVVYVIRTSIFVVDRSQDRIVYRFFRSKCQGSRDVVYRLRNLHRKNSLDEIFLANCPSSLSITIFEFLKKKKKKNEV